MTEPHLEKAKVLIERNRFNEAEKSLRLTLSKQPNNVEALSLLAICLSEKKEFDEANEAMKAAIATEPNNPQLLYLFSRVLFEQEEFAKAEEYIKSAIAFYPYEADYFGIWAAIFLNKKDWKNALAKADEGLAIDPENLMCLNTRSTALVKLNKKKEAFDTISEALNQNPDNEVTHTNYGWGLLEKGEHKKALEHFRQALQHNPNFTWAKQGLLEALKARYLVYRIFLKYTFWISNLSSKVQWAIIIGLYFGVRLLNGWADQNQTVGMVAKPLIYAYMVFAISTWVISPLANVFLRFNVYGKYALSRDEKIASNLVAVSAFIGLLGFGSYIFIPDLYLLFIGILGISMMIPLSSMLRPKKQKSRVILITYSALLLIMGCVAIYNTFQSQEPGAIGTLYIYGLVVYQFVANAFIAE
ncbi:tetratricopeptide repeat protein [Fulvivirgaceae bacterium BMA10]|uniref:Tetratricopeptide repeat protein n=1 Tax=Splendidivirga corallicola TaxID=3051826 RepID=A0ABT8KKQ0_9BACT|nr:tetratricopeptide repeat protein [Fulvivirgaceae bacterium BMA10]